MNAKDFLTSYNLANISFISGILTGGLKKRNWPLVETVVMLLTSLQIHYHMTRDYQKSNIEYNVFMK